MLPHCHRLVNGFSVVGTTRGDAGDAALHLPHQSSCLRCLIGVAIRAQVP